MLKLFSSQNFQKEKIFQTKEIDGEIECAARRQEDKVRKYHDRYERLKLYNLKENKSILTDNNELCIYTDGEEKFRDLIREIRKAGKYICLEYYIIRGDEIWRAIRKELEKKVKEGVEVRVLFDSIGCRKMKRKEWKELKKAGIQVTEFFPALFGCFQLHMNYRNHRKIVVIDGKCGFIGGFNIGREYVGKEEAFGNWRDTHIRIKGGAVVSLLIRFVLDWNYAAGENLFRKDHLFGIPAFENTGNTPIQIISSGPDSSTPVIRNNYLQLIHMAKKKIYIQTPYFIPDDAIKEALIVAARSGIDVRIMTPCKPDHPFVHWATRSYLGEMLRYGVKCFFYEDGFLHAKSLCIDESVSCLGTANMDIRSFSLNFEINAVIYSEQITQRLMTEFENDMLNSREMTKTDYEKRGMQERVKERCSRLFSPIL